MIMASLVADYSDSEDEYSQESDDVSLNPRVKEEAAIAIKQEAPEIKQEVIDIKVESSYIKHEPVDIKHEPVDIKHEPVDFDIKQETIDTVHETHSKSTHPVSNFFITADNGDDDDDDDEKYDSSCVTSIKSKKETSSKLANPLAPQKLPSINDASSLMMAGSSVFVNRFEREEHAKNKILEKHVRLTVAAPKKPAHQPMCWKFKKGNCHRGKNCRFFHDMDALSSVDDSASAETNKQNSANPNASNERKRSSYHPAAFHNARMRPLEDEPVDDDNYMASMKKKKRFGINDALMPPKKAYESLLQMRQKERPWTLPNGSS